ncbi:ABC transporter permease subunit [Nocardioides sp. GY 10113]|uniref:ABC transporter permease n=1 Tax=Nocardioides sp. GY 10113 TaxID=2569761 RepID=UPI0010A792A6|nr:ABC transporter permease subunit [Nocardioides sp. GY 10113]TIC89122.1 ABC transporter permease subunit [Nocardioides sp. GY 10113]
MSGTSATGAPPGWTRIGRIAAPVVVGLLGLAVWQFLVSVVEVSPYLLPGPAEIAEEWRANSEAIREAFWITGTNAFIGLVAGTLAGVGLAAVSSSARWAEGMAAPVVAGLAVVPIVALAPVLNSMYGADSEYGRRVIAAIAAFVPVYVNSVRGLHQTTALHRDLMRAYHASAGQRFRRLTLPSAAPYVLTGIRIASSLAVISALVAEYFGGPRGGLGSFISTSAATSAYARAWAYVAAAIVLGLVAYVVTALLERLVQHFLPTGAAS